MSLCWMGKRTNGGVLLEGCGLGARSPSFLAVLCFNGELRGEVGVAGFRAARAVLVQNSFQLSPLLHKKLVILRKA